MIEERSAIVQEILGKPAGWAAQWGIYIVISGLLLLTGITWMIPCDETISIPLAIIDDNRYEYCAVIYSDHLLLKKNDKITVVFLSPGRKEISVEGAVDTVIITKTEYRTLVRFKTESSVHLAVGMIGMAKIEQGKTRLFYRLINIFQHSSS